MSESLREEILWRKAARGAGGASPPNADVDRTRPNTPQQTPLRTRRPAQAGGPAGPVVAELLSRLKARRGGQLEGVLEAKLIEAEEARSHPWRPVTDGDSASRGATSISWAELGQLADDSDTTGDATAARPA